MLYQLHELQRKFLNPLSVWAQATSELFSSPYSPFAYTPMSRRLAAGYELLHRLGKPYDKPQFDLGTTTVDGQTVPVSEEVVLTKPFCKLLHFQRVMDRVADFAAKLAKSMAIGGKVGGGRIFAARFIFIDRQLHEK